jgi:hypothetical protein
MEGAMRWYFFVAYFFGGAFLVNAVPHFVNGVSGHRQNPRSSHALTPFLKQHLDAILRT